MKRLASFVLGHKLLVVLTWLALAVAGFATISTTTHRLTATFSLPGQPGYVTDTRIAALYHNGGGQTPTVLTLTVPAGILISDPGTAARAGRAFAAAAASVPGTRVADAATTGDPHFVTSDGRTAFALVFTPPSGGEGQPDLSPAISAALSAAAPPAWRPGVTGLTQLQNGSTSSKGSSTTTEVLLGAGGSLIVLVFVFASFLALVPLLMAAVAIPVTFLLVLGLTHLTSVSFIVEFLIALIGLGVAIDYSLLVVTRWREFRANGAGNHTAVIAAMDSAGRAVLFSGLTVAISLLALVVLPVQFLSNIGFAGFFIPLVSIAVATTLLPVLLATAGPALDWPRVRHEAAASRPWSAWARLVIRYRKTAAVLAGAILLALLIPLLSLRLGEPSTAALAQRGPAQAALAALTGHGVPSGIIAPIEILTRPADAAATAARLDQIPGIHTAVAPATASYRQGGTAIVDALPAAEPSSPAGEATIAAVQQAMRNQPGVIGVGGAGPSQADFIHAVYGSFPLMLTLIALFTLVLLTRAFRSVVLAAKAVIFNMISVGAAYGVMVLVWQMGYGSTSIWSIPATGSITVWVPIMVFAFLFGLSMDYEVFILSRMREEYDTTGSTPQAIIAGIGRTGRLVTSAALILFLAFIALATAPGTDLKVMATGLGAGILLDALVVRCLLLPALVGVLGRWNWWLPSWAAKALRVAPSAVPASAAT
jgi:putative drug exporter of the RND superfamily